jgi:hypothetical protein
MGVLRRLAEHAATPPHEAAAAAAAIARITARTGAEKATGERWPQQNGPTRRRARRRNASERPARHRLHVGDIVDAEPRVSLRQLPVRDHRRRSRDRIRVPALPLWARAEVVEGRF